MSTLLSDIKNSQIVVNVGGGGEIDNTPFIHGTMNLNLNSNLSSAGVTLLQQATVVHGNVSSIQGITVPVSIPFDSTSNAHNISISANNGTNGDGSGGNGASAQLTENTLWTSNGIIQGGTGGSTFNPYYGDQTAGGTAFVTFDPTRSSYPTITLNQGLPGTDNIGQNPAVGGNAGCYLTPSQTSLTLTIADNNSSTSGWFNTGFNYVPAGISNITVSGSSLTSLTLNLSSGGGDYWWGTHDYSVCPLSQASVMALIDTYIAMGLSNLTPGGVTYPTLNIGGNCASLPIEAEVDQIGIYYPYNAQDGDSFSFGGNSAQVTVVYSAAIPCAASSVTGNIVTMGISDSPDQDTFYAKFIPLVTATADPIILAFTNDTINGTSYSPVIGNSGCQASNIIGSPIVGASVITPEGPYKVYLFTNVGFSVIYN